ncbi:glycine receptor subunit alpha-3 [Trichonephila clavipes]|nr:glycine receptor subunit alpha-3 [Trichonephila clavipes]
MRLTLRLSCHMSFRLYPLDAQRCWVVLGSYAQTTDQVLIQWRDESPITIEKEIEVPEFRVVPQAPGTFCRDIDTGVFSFLNVSFVFLRQNGYHLVQTYLPTFLIVMMSWVSFWVPVEAAPARVTLGVTTLLSLTTVASGIRSQLPPVSYAKAIDIWIGACSVMVFSALLEFALASYLCRMKIRHRQPKTTCLIFAKPRRSDSQMESKNQVVHTPESDKKIQLRRSHAGLCGISYRSIAARLGREPMTVRRIWNRWSYDGNTELRAGSQRSPITSRQAFTRMALMDCAAMSRAVSQELRSLARQQMSTRTVG